MTTPAVDTGNTGTTSAPTGGITIPAGSFTTSTPATYPVPVAITPPPKSPQEGNPPAEDEDDDKDGEEKLGDAGKQALTRMKADLRAEKTRAKAAEDALTELQRQNQTESERALTDAEKRGAATATAELGKQLARAKFDALAARRNTEVDAEAITEFMDMGRFVNDKGEVDLDALRAAVDRLVPEPVKARVASYDGGARETGRNTSTSTPGMGRMRDAYADDAKKSRT